MSDDEVTIYITTMKVIGRWSVQNGLIFCLGREDVFSGENLIIQNAMALLFNLN